MDVQSANAGGGGGGGGGGRPRLAAVTKVRSLFPETWLWLDVNARFV
jgi:hypothetical protein